MVCCSEFLAILGSQITFLKLCHLALVSQWHWTDKAFIPLKSKRWAAAGCVKPSRCRSAQLHTEWSKEYQAMFKMPGLPIAQIWMLADASRAWEQCLGVSNISRRPAFKINATESSIVWGFETVVCSFCSIKTWRSARRLRQSRQSKHFRLTEFWNKSTTRAHMVVAAKHILDLWMSNCSLGSGRTGPWSWL